MPTQYLSGKPYPRAVDPVPSRIADGRGLYRWSAFYAPLAALTQGGGIEADDTLGGKAVSLLLFTSDIPVIARAHVYDSSTKQYNTAALPNLKTLPAQFVADTSGGGAAVTISNYGEVLKGYAGAGQAVAVSGFPCNIYNGVVAPFSATVTNGVVQAGAADSVAIECLANGAVASGVVGTSFYGKVTFGSTTAPTPVILLASDYTQAIKDNDNLLVDDAGLLAQVVGLYFSA